MVDGVGRLILDRRFEFRGDSVAWGAMGGGEPIVMVHGFPWSAQSWRRIAPWLCRTHRVYFYDMVGCGASGKSVDQDVTARAQGELLAALVKHWELEQPQLIAHDFGGLAALRAHFLHGVDYAKLHLIDAVGVLPSGSPFFAHVAQHAAAFDGLPEYAHRALFDAYIRAATVAQLPDEVANLYYEPWSGDAGQRAFYRQIAQSSPDPIAEVQKSYGKTRFDVHLIWGEEDGFISLAQGEELRGHLGADSLTVVPNAGHLLQEDAAEAVMATLLAHI